MRKGKLIFYIVILLILLSILGVIIGSKFAPRNDVKAYAEELTETEEPAEPQADSSVYSPYPDMLPDYMIIFGAVDYYIIWFDGSGNYGASIDSIFYPSGSLGELSFSTGISSWASYDNTIGLSAFIEKVKAKVDG